MGVATLTEPSFEADNLVGTIARHAPEQGYDVLILTNDRDQLQLINEQARICANMVFDRLVTPRVLGGAIGLRPLASLFAILVGAQVFGIWGMLLAVPLATAGFRG